jgi:hypothetical protein
VLELAGDAGAWACIGDCVCWVALKVQVDHAQLMVAVQELLHAVVICLRRKMPEKEDVTECMNAAYCCYKDRA